MIDEHDDHNPADDITDAGHSRRSALMFGGMGLGAILAGGTLLRAAPSFAEGPILGSTGAPFDIVMALYENGTLLDFAGPSEVFHEVPNMRIRFASLNGGPVTLQYGVVFGKTERLADIPKTDLLLVPGGPDLREAMSPAFQKQLIRLGSSAKYITSVCNGSLPLAATGLLKGKKSACHWAFVNQLARYGAIPDPQRFVTDDNNRFMSGGGVTSGIDFALRVTAILRGQDASEFAQLVIEYDPDPPFKSGHPRVARPEVIAMVDKVLPGASRGLAVIPGLN